MNKISFLSFCTHYFSRQFLLKYNITVRPNINTLLVRMLKYAEDFPNVTLSPYNAIPSVREMHLANTMLTYLPVPY